MLNPIQKRHIEIKQGVAFVNNVVDFFSSRFEQQEFEKLEISILQSTQIPN